MRILDLFCGAGGASYGIHLAGHEVDGVDINKDLAEEYPFKFYWSDALTFLMKYGCDYDAFHASPPCQHYSQATRQWVNLGNEYPDLIALTRAALEYTGKPFVIENVIGAPLRKDLLLCGQMFDDGSKEFVVRRHRIFEIHGFTVSQIPHEKHIGKVGDGRVISVFGHGGGVRYNHATSDLNAWKTAMGTPWMKKRRSVSESIPPDYTKYIFSFLKA